MTTITDTNDTAMTPPAVIVNAADRGIRLWLENGSIRYWSPSALDPSIRQELAANKSAVIAYLGHWSRPEAARLVAEADALVARLGVDGRDARVWAAAEAVTRATTAGDMVQLRLRVAEFEGLVRRLAEKPEPVQLADPLSGWTPTPAGDAVVAASTDPAAVGGSWVGGRWNPARRAS